MGRTRSVYRDSSVDTRVTGMSRIIDKKLDNRALIFDLIFLTHVKALERGTAKYLIRRVGANRLRFFIIICTATKTVFCQLPTRIVVGLVYNRALNGHREQNPFQQFQNTCTDDR